MCGVLPTRAAVRQNLIARSRRRVLSVQDTVNKVNASPDTRVLDIKP
jgi:tRNA (Thr-GGU) A37 N-methylase